MYRSNRLYHLGTSRMHQIRNVGQARVLRKIPVILCDPNKTIDWKDVFHHAQPVIIRGLVSTWPAISDTSKQWSNLTQLKRRTDEDTVVPIEMGDNYMDPKLIKANVGLGSLLEYFMLGKEAISSSPRVYWAQNDLNEVPEMFADIAVPEMVTATGKGHLYKTNVWFGGALGSASPCHYDPYHNLLCQVVGRKEVTVFSQEFGQRYLYPAEGTVQKNTSLVDMEKPDLSTHPLYGEALRIVNEGIQTESVNREVGASKVIENDVIKRTPAQHELIGAAGVLEVGDALYIPYKWWHFCSTDATSCSVNFWWL